MQPPYEIDVCVEDLRAALQAHGITLPSLGADLPAFASAGLPPLVTLGNCNTTTARALARALRQAAAE
ncbi:hypothetical protein ABZX40_21910 [Streptomyces sp. NPDC004610]|uniref:hypothetical protein n=1 Tax=unclassified Streptomyces TaxID=2593676 RepID=UPI0033A4CECA